MDKYIEDSLELRDAGADKYGQYIHGGVIPTIDQQREQGMLTKGKVKFLFLTNFQGSHSYLRVERDTLAKP